MKRPEPFWLVINTRDLTLCSEGESSYSLKDDVFYIAEEGRDEEVFDLTREFYQAFVKIKEAEKNNTPIVLQIEAHHKSEFTHCGSGGIHPTSSKEECKHDLFYRVCEECEINCECKA